MATPASADASAVNPTTARSGSIVSASADPPPVVRMSKAAAVQTPRKRPTAPPADDRTAPSMRSCRMMRARLAPSAVRIAISRCRVYARVKRRLATFAAAMMRISPTTSINSLRGRPRSSTSDVSPAAAGLVRTYHSEPSAFSFARMAAVICACACSTAIPGRVRPTRDIQLECRSASRSTGLWRSGKNWLTVIQRSTRWPRVKPVNDAGATPTTVVARPFTCSVLPIAPRS
jgi:hypothetical protein